MNAVIYARYSSDNQREESIEGQLRECKEFAEANDMIIVDTYIDRALSAKTDNRPEFQKMVKDSAKGAFELVIVWKLDRFARNRYDSAHYKAVLQKNGVKVVSATEKISQTPEGILLESLLEGMAEYYSAELAEKVTRGLTENALKCKYNGGTLPIGYAIDENQFFIIDPLTAPAVLDAFKHYAEGATMQQITDELNLRGVRTKKNTRITLNTVTRMLHNRRYIGEYKYSDITTPNGIPPIVPVDLFERVQDMMKANKKAPAKHKAEDEYLLTTKLFCGKCKCLMAGESGTSHTKHVHRYYKCVSVKYHRGCDKKTVRKEWIEDIVISHLMKIIFDDDLMDKLADALLIHLHKENDTLPILQKQFAETQKSIDNMLNAIQQGIFTTSTKERLEALEREKSELSVQIMKEELSRPNLTKEQILFWIHKFRKLNPKKLEHRRRLINSFLNSVYLFDDKIIIDCNYKDGTETITFEEIENSALGSDLRSLAAPKRQISEEICLFRWEKLLKLWVIYNIIHISNINEGNYMKNSTMKRVVTIILALCMFTTVAAGIAVHAESDGINPPVFSHEGGVYTKAFTLTIASDGNEVFYTLDGSIPNQNSTIYTAPIEIDPKKISPRSVQGRVSQERWEKGIVVRAVSADENGNLSEVVTNTYFVSDKIAEVNKNVPIVAISGNPYDFWDQNEGIYTNYSYEHNIIGYVEYFDNNGEGFERSLELKVSGHGSRSNPKKSIRLYFTKGDTEGRKNIEYDLIEVADKNFYDTSKVKKHGKITFRISDWAETDLRDPMAQRITEFMRPDTASSTPAALFINGEFWGIYEAREQYDNRYLDYHYEGIDKDEVILLDRDWTTENYTYTLSDNGYQGVERILYEEGPEEDEEYYRDQYNYVQYLMLNAADEKMYEELEGYVDIDNLIDYLFVYMYCDNIDWPGNNFKFWRTSMERSNGDVYAADGKWRFMVHDFDLAFDGVTNNTFEYVLKSNLPETEPRHPGFAAKVFDGLFKNEKFRNKFAQRCAAYLDTAVSVENITLITEDLIKDREAVKGYDLLRWNNMSGTSTQRLQTWKDRTRRKFIGFAEGRNPYFEKMISDFYKKYYKSEIGETTDFSFEIDTNKASVDIDGAIIRESFYSDKAKSFATSQYTNIPVTISAECKEGYVVKSITVNGEKFDGGSVTIVPEKIDYKVSFEIVEGEKEEKTVSQIKVMREGRFNSMKTGEKLPVEVIATYTDGTSERVYGYTLTTETSCVDVLENGIIIAKTLGSGNITVTYKGAKANLALTVE